MLRKALFNIIRQEQREIEDELEKEEQTAPPNSEKLAALRREAHDLGRELEHYADP